MVTASIVVISAVVITVVVAILILVRRRWQLKQELRNKAADITLNFINPGDPPKERFEQYKEFFPECCRTLADGDDKDDSEESQEDIEHEIEVNQSFRIQADSDVAIKPLVIQSSRIQADSDVAMKPPVTISLDWLKTTDMLLSLIQNKKKREELMHHVSVTMRREKWRIASKQSSV